jgi:hypothetical protein
MHVQQPLYTFTLAGKLPVKIKMGVHFVKRFPRSFFKYAISTRNVHLTLHSDSAAVVHFHNTTTAKPPQEKDATKILITDRHLRFKGGDYEDCDFLGSDVV